MNPLVSWLIPVYNCKKVARALDSMLAQTYTNFELILVLEFSTNQETVAVCEAYAEQDKRIHIIYNTERLGIAKSLNVGIKHCKGKYIARMDADDYSYPDRLEKQVAYMEAHPQVDVLGGNNGVIDENTGKVRRRYAIVPDNDLIRATLMFHMYLDHPVLMLRNTEELKYPEVITEDYALFASMISKWQMEVLPDRLLDYYRNENCISSLRFTEARNAFVEISRATIKRELGIDTDGYHESLFGWRDFDSMPEKPWDFLKQAYSLYQKISVANKKVKLFREEALQSVLNEEWKKSLEIVYPCGFPELHKPLDEITEEQISEQECLARREITGEKRLVIYGTGLVCNRWLEAASEQQIKNIVCFCDSDSKKQGTMLFNKPIIAPEELSKQEFDVIAIATPNYQAEIKKKIKELGILEEKIKRLPLPERAK